MNRLAQSSRAGPVAYLLAGLPGSGKSTHARRLARSGVIRISIDDLMLSRHGRIGVDYPIDAHHSLMAPILTEARQQLQDTIIAGHSVVLDHGLGRRDERDEWKLLVARSGATWQLLRFDAPHSVLQRRLAARRLPTIGSPGAVPLTAEMFDFLVRTYEPPVGEGETAIETWPA